MATQTPHADWPDLDLDASPFEPQAIEALPLTKEQRADLRRFLEEARREREEKARRSSHAGRSTSPKL